MRLLLTALLCASVYGAQSAYDIVRRSCERDSENVALREQYTYRHTNNVRRLDKNGRVQRTELTVNEVLWIDGTRYSRLIEKDGKPLNAKEQKEEQEKLDRETAKRKRESPDQRRKRLAERRKNLEEERQLRMQIPEAYTFTLLGEEKVNGRDCYRITADPKPGFKPKGREAGFLPKLRGTLWIDKSDYEWARVDAETLDTISVGLALFRIGKGARLEVEQALVNNELWAPSLVRVTANARALLLLTARFDTLIRFHDYRKYTVDSVVTVTDGQ